MINTLVSREYPIGTEVETVERYNGIVGGWHGIITNSRITEDGLFHEYTIKHENGSVRTLPGNIVRPYIRGARNNIEQIISNMTIFIEDEDELKDFKKAYSIIERDFSGYALAVAMYTFGKMIGRNNERLDRKRKKLMKNFRVIH